MFRNIIDTFKSFGNTTLKAVTPNDDMYVDPEGKHIIFRTVHGKTIPIKTDAEGYADWLQKQGVNIDPADQTTLNQLEKQLEVLEEAQRVGGPELQKQYEDAFAKQREQYGQIVQNYYQQALQHQAEQQQTTPEKVQESKKQRYEQHKEEVKSRGSMSDRGWGSYIQAFTDRLAKNGGYTPNEKGWYTIKALDVLLMRGLELAKQGEDPSNIDVSKLLADELQNSTGLKKYFDERYAPYKDEAEDPYSIISNLYPGVANLKKNFDDNPEVADFVRSTFDSMYRKMYDDFHKKEIEQFEPFKPSEVMGEEGLAPIPSELPEKIGGKETQALFNVFKNTKGSRLGATHRVALHVLGRLFSDIDEKDRINAAVSLSDANSGLNAAHKSSYSDIYRKYKQFGIDVNVDDAVEEMLRDAIRASNGTTTDKINAMKKIASRLGEIDGLANVKVADKGYNSHRAQWNNVAINAGRAKGEGPDLNAQILDPDKVQNHIIPNELLKIPHGGPQKKEGPTTEDLPQPEEEQTQEVEYNRPNEIHPGFTKQDDTILSDDGYRIRIEGQKWYVTSPEGANVGTVNVKPVAPENFKQNKDYVFGVVRKLIDNYKARNEPETQPVEPDEGQVRVPVFNFGQELSENETNFLNDLTETLEPNGIEVSSVIPGKVFRLNKGDKSIDLLYNPKKGQLMTSYHDANGTLQLGPADMDTVNSVLGETPKNEVPSFTSEKKQPVEQEKDLSHLSDEDKQKLQELKDTYAKEEESYKSRIKANKSRATDNRHNFAKNEAMRLGFEWSKRKKELQKQINDLENPPKEEEEAPKEKSPFDMGGGKLMGGGKKEETKPAAKQEETPAAPAKEEAPKQEEPTKEPEKQEEKKPVEKRPKLKVGDTHTIERQSGFGNTQKVTIEVMPDNKAKVVSWERKKKGEDKFKPVPDEVGKVSSLDQFFPGAEEESTSNETQKETKPQEAPETKKEDNQEETKAPSLDEDKAPSSEVKGDKNYFRGDFSRSELEDVLKNADASKVYWEKKGSNYKVYMPEEMYNNWTKTQDYYKDETEKSVRNIIDSFRF